MFIAFGVGTIQIANLLSERYGCDDVQPFQAMASLNFTLIGVVVVATFLVGWAGALLIWKVRRYDEQYVPQTAAHPAPDAVPPRS